MPPEDREEPRERRASVFPAPGDTGAWTLEIIVAAIVFVLVLAAIGYYLERGLDWYLSFVDAAQRAWERIRAIVMVLAIMASAALAGFTVVIWRRFNALKTALPDMALGAVKVGTTPLPPERAKKEIGNEWQEVRKLMASDNRSDWNMAVLRADTLLDDVLQYLDYEGTTVKERLDIVDPMMVPSLDRLLSAHRLRNAIAHDPTIAHTRETIDYALRVYETAFRELGVMAEEVPQ
ncbi:MAG: hypothetical protein AAB533_03525 [Patescibacteria group bacterium]